MTQIKDIGVPDGSPFVEIDGVQLAYSRDGRGPAVVCLHAIGHGGRDFEFMTRALSTQFEIIRIDWPGQGRSQGDHKPTSAARYAELLDGALRKLQINSPIILGNSIGGAAAIIHASHQPVRALVLCNPGGLIEVTPAIARACRTMASFFDAGARNRWWFKSAFWAYYRFLVLPSPKAKQQRNRIIAAGSELAAVLRDAWLSFAEPSADIRSVALNLTVPVWFAWAAGDRIIQLKQCKPVIDKIKHATLTKFGGGHAAFLERPNQFVRKFKKFAATLDRIK